MLTHLDEARRPGSHASDDIPDEAPFDDRTNSQFGIVPGHVEAHGSVASPPSTVPVPSGTLRGTAGELRARHQGPAQEVRTPEHSRPSSLNLRGSLANASSTAPPYATHQLTPTAPTPGDSGEVREEDSDNEDILQAVIKFPHD